MQNRMGIHCLFLFSIPISRWREFFPSISDGNVYFSSFRISEYSLNIWNIEILVIWNRCICKSMSTWWKTVIMILEYLLKIFKTICIQKNNGELFYKLKNTITLSLHLCNWLTIVFDGRWIFFSDISPDNIYLQII